MGKLILKNGKIYVEQGVFAQAILMENGTITAVGTNEKMAALCTEAQVIDCEGKTVVPGLMTVISHGTAWHGQNLRSCRGRHH